MTKELKFVWVHLIAIIIIILNCIYFFPRNIKWLSLESSKSMGYTGIEIMCNYFIYIFFFFACLSLLANVNKQNKLFFLIFSIVLSLLNFIFAFIGIGFIIILPLFIYTGVFYAIYRQILNDKKATSYKTINIVGLVITLVWLTLDFIIFG
jgi:hypothetical protein